MKKVILVALLLTGGGISSYGDPVQVYMQIINKSASGAGPTYAPPRPWYITEDNYVLTIPAFEDDYTLELRDEDDNVVYSTVIPTGTTSLFLPSYLSGNYEIQIIQGNLCFYGYIIL